jgi:hypothetical protein
MSSQGLFGWCLCDEKVCATRSTSARFCDDQATRRTGIALISKKLEFIQTPGQWLLLAHKVSYAGCRTEAGRIPGASAVALKHPTKKDFEVRISETAVEVIFKPTNSHHTYPKDVVEFGPLSPDPRIRHAGRRGDVGNYLAPEVLAMAFRLALKTVRRN